MAYDDASFRAQMPEFSDTTKYPAATLGAMWALGTSYIDAPTCPLSCLSAQAYPVAANYMAAHLWVLSNQQSSSGNAPGTNQGGFEVSASIDKISVSMLPPPADNMWKWWLTQTPYGQALAALLRISGVGGTSVGGLPERAAFRKVGGVFM